MQISSIRTLARCIFYPWNFLLLLLRPHQQGGMMHLQGGDPATGVGTLLRAVELKQLPAACKLMGYGYMQAGDMEKAKAFCEKQQEVASDHLHPYDSMGDVLMA